VAQFLSNAHATSPAKTARSTTRAVLNGLVPVSPCKLHQVTGSFHMIAKNMAVTRINLLHQIWCNIQKHDHMMATLESAD
jgi:hypothetical protein